MAKVHAGSVIKWVLIVAVIYVAYRLVIGWTNRAVASLSGTGSGSVVSAPSQGSYASPGGYYYQPQPIAIAPVPVASGSDVSSVAGSFPYVGSFPRPQPQPIIFGPLKFGSF